jgi:hypothetical protein
MVSFEANEPTERPDPTHYLRKREGSPGGLKQAQRPAAVKTGSPGRRASPGGGSGLIAAARGASPGSPGSPGAAQRSTTFWKMYQRGALPVRVDQDRPGRNGLKWTADLASIDLHYYLPIFVDGLLETQEPFRMLARSGVQELIAGCAAARVLPVIPQLIMGLRAALRSPLAEVVQAGLHTIDLLVERCEGAGQALVPYYRQLLPPIAHRCGPRREACTRCRLGVLCPQAHLHETLGSMPGQAQAVPLPHVLCLCYCPTLCCCPPHPLHPLPLPPGWTTT